MAGKEGNSTVLLTRNFTTKLPNFISIHLYTILLLLNNNKWTYLINLTTASVEYLVLKAF